MDLDDYHRYVPRHTNCRPHAHMGMGRIVAELEHSPWNCSWVIIKELYQWAGNIGSGNGLVPAPSHYLSRCCSRPVSPYGVTRSRWVRQNIRSTLKPMSILWTHIGLNMCRCVKMIISCHWNGVKCRSTDPGVWVYKDTNVSIKWWENDTTHFQLTIAMSTYRT